ncbi:MAG: hypothetical protein JNL82_20050 [Myxococcales bacterium]|nr:hypothetical protein [Myxococcales bacterium]
MRRSSQRRFAAAGRPGAWLLACALGCGGEPADPGDDGDAGADDEAAESTSGGETAAAPGPQEPARTCEDAPRAKQGQFAGTLRGDEELPSEGGVCGGGGPDRFLRVMVPQRADLRVEARGNGFVPRVGLTPGCVGASPLACGADGIATVTDVAGGTELVLTIGADPQQFAGLLAEDPPVDGPDPLGFVVAVGMTPVLAADEVCMPAALGRCASGTLCMPPRAEDDGWRCTALAGDSCAEPERVALELSAGAGTLRVDPDRPQSDAHRHRCTGGGTRERVLQVELPAGLGPLDSLRIRSDRPEVGLAVRAPSCLGSDELDCGAPGVGGAEVTIEAPGELHAAGVAPYVFVELPDPGVLTDEVVLQVRVVLRAPPAGTP